MSADCCRMWWARIVTSTNSSPGSNIESAFLFSTTTKRQTPYRRDRKPSYFPWCDRVFIFKNRQKREPSLEGSAKIPRKKRALRLDDRTARHEFPYGFSHLYDTWGSGSDGTRDYQKSCDCGSAKRKGQREKNRPRMKAAFSRVGSAPASFEQS